MIESNLSEIPNEVIRRSICKIIESSLNSNRYEITLSSASEGGENNFCGIIYRVLFNEEAKTNGEHILKSSLIVKLAPQNTARRIQFHSHEMFLQEIYIYNEVLPFFHEFEISKGVSEKNFFIEYPKFYQTFNDEPSECLLLEDLCARGFTDIDRCNEEISADHVWLIMKTLGKFHAISLALKDQQPQKFNELASNIKDVFIRTDTTLFVKYYNKVVKSTLGALKNQEDQHLFARIEKLFVRDGKDLLNSCFDLELTGFASVISYGDAWQNNTMFKYDERGTPIEVCFLDWQVPCHSSPIIDIVYFMFCCTTKELRDVYYEKALKVYHESLSTHIRRLGSDPHKLFPYALMQEHLHKFGKYGFIMATVILPMLATEKGSGLNLDGMADNSGNSANTQIFDTFLLNSKSKFNNRLRDIVVDMVQLGYI